MDFSKHLKTIFGLGSPYFSSKNVFSLSLSLFFSSKNLSLKDHFFQKFFSLVQHQGRVYIQIKTSLETTQNWSAHKVFQPATGKLGRQVKRMYRTVEVSTVRQTLFYRTVETLTTLIFVQGHVPYGTSLYRTVEICLPRGRVRLLSRPNFARPPRTLPNSVLGVLRTVGKLVKSTF